MDDKSSVRSRSNSVSKVGTIPTSQSSPPSAQYDEHIHMFVRIRPMTRREVDDGERVVVRIGEITTTAPSPAASTAPSLADPASRQQVVIVDDEGTRAPKSYAADTIFGPQSTQSEVFQRVLPLLSSTLSGCNSTILAYGCTSGGKVSCVPTVMMGPQRNVISTCTIM